MQLQSPLVTIVVAVYNGAATIQRCLDSIRNQTFLNHELVIIDGESTDETVSILEVNSDIISHWVSEPDEGIYDAWNKALPHATGEWILFLGADDFLYSPDVLEKVSSRLRSAYPKYRLTYGKVAHIDGDEKTIRIFGDPWKSAKPVMKRRMPIPHQATFHHQKLFEEFGSFDTSFRICGDYDFLLRELLRKDPLFFDILVASMSWGGVSTNSDHAWQHLREIVRLRRKNGLPPLSPLLIRQMIGETVFSLVSLATSKRASNSLRRSYNYFLKRPI